MNKKKRTLLQIMCIFLLILAGCGRKDARSEGDRQETSDDDAFQVYCTNAEGTRLTSFAYTPQAENFDGIMGELLDCFAAPKGEEYVSLLKDGTEILSYTAGVDTVTVDFNTTYLGLSNVNEILLRAGIVKTLAQVKGVIYVQITVDGQPITEENGEKVGPMNDETFVDGRKNSINSYRTLGIKLYFPDAEGTTLVAEEREAHYSSNVPLERMIVDKIIEGPEMPGSLAVTSPAVEINSVKSQDGVCVIDLDIGFNQIYNELVTPEMCLYTFVNTIISETDNEAVRFLIDGTSDVRFQGQISLDQTFTEDLSYFGPADEEAEDIAATEAGEEGE